MAANHLGLPLALALCLDLLTARVARATTCGPVLGTDERLRTWAEHWGWLPGDEREPPLPSALLLFPIDAREVARAVTRVAPGGQLAVVAPGRLARPLAWARGERPPRLGAAPIKRALRDAGLVVELACGVGSWVSPAYALASRAAERGDRPDLVDRFELGYRRSLTPREGSDLADLVAIAARAT
jgi:hypothetical protein